MDITDQQIIQILSLVAEEPRGKYKKNGRTIVDDQWWGHDTTCGTTAELLAEAREILEPLPNWTIYGS